MSQNMFAWGAAFLEEQMHQHCSVEVKYRRGSAPAIILRAVLGSQLLKVSDSYGDTRIERTDRDYIIRASDLGSLGAPQRGDIIEEQQGSVTHVYEVMAYGNEQPARYSDVTTHRTWRIHAKQIEVKT